MRPNDPYKTQPLPALTQNLGRPITLPLPALVALALVGVLVGALVGAPLVGALWGGAGRASPQPTLVILTPTLGVTRAAIAGPSLARAAVAYASPGGAVVGALEPGRAYRLIARSGLAWAQLDVAAPGAPPNLIWVTAGDVPEIATIAGLADLATPALTATAQVIYVAAPAPAPPATPTQTYILAPATPAPQSVVMKSIPTAPPCTLRELGSVLRICNGIVP